MKHRYAVVALMIVGAGGATACDSAQLPNDPLAPNFAASATEVQLAASFNSTATFENGTWAPFSDLIVQKNVVSTIPTGGAHGGSRYGKWTATVPGAGAVRRAFFDLHPGRRVNMRFFIKSPPPLTAATFAAEIQAGGTSKAHQILQNGTQAGWSSFAISWYNDTGVLQPVELIIGASNGTGSGNISFSFSLDDIRVWDSQPASFNSDATFENGTWAPFLTLLTEQNVVAAIPTGGAHKGTRYGQWTATAPNAGVGVIRNASFDLLPGRRVNMKIFIKSPPPLTASQFIAEIQVGGFSKASQSIQNGTRAGWSSFTISWFNNTGVVQPVELYIGALNGTGPDSFSFSLDDIRVWSSP